MDPGVQQPNYRDMDKKQPLKKRQEKSELSRSPQGYESFVSIQDKGNMFAVPEPSQSTVNRPNQVGNNLNFFEQARHGNESSLSVPFSPYLPSGDMNSSEQQSYSPSPLGQSDLEAKNGNRRPDMNEMQSPIHLISIGEERDQRVRLVHQQSSSNTSNINRSLEHNHNTDQGASQESLG